MMTLERLIDGRWAVVIHVHCSSLIVSDAIRTLGRTNFHFVDLTTSPFLSRRILLFCCFPPTSLGYSGSRCAELLEVWTPCTLHAMLRIRIFLRLCKVVQINNFQRKISRVQICKNVVWVMQHCQSVLTQCSRIAILVTSCFCLWSLQPVQCPLNELLSSTQYTYNLKSFTHAQWTVYSNYINISTRTLKENFERGRVERAESEGQRYFTTSTTRC